MKPAQFSHCSKVEGSLTTLYLYLGLDIYSILILGYTLTTTLSFMLTLYYLDSSASWVVSSPIQENLHVHLSAGRMATKKWIYLTIQLNGFLGLLQTGSAYQLKDSSKLGLCLRTDLLQALESPRLGTEAAHKPV